MEEVTVTLEGFCWNIPVVLLIEVHLSVILAWNLWGFFYKIVIFFLAEIQQPKSFSMLKTKKLIKSCSTVVEVHQYQLGAISLYLKGAAISVTLFASIVP